MAKIIKFETKEERVRKYAEDIQHGIMAGLSPVELYELIQKKDRYETNSDQAEERN